MDRNTEIDLIKTRLIELGARIELDDSQRKTIVRFDQFEASSSHWIEVGFLLGQWTRLIGVEFPRHFPRNKAMLGDAFRFDVDPGGMDFTF